MGEGSVLLIQWQSLDKTNVTLKKLTEQLGLRGCQEHYDAYVKDLVVRQREDGSEVVEFREGPPKTTVCLMSDEEPHHK